MILYKQVREKRRNHFSFFYLLITDKIGNVLIVKCGTKIERTFSISINVYNIFLSIRYCYQKKVQLSSRLK